jgi:MinD superfamily P-loop ATPase
MGVILSLRCRLQHEVPSGCNLQLSAGVVQSGSSACPEGGSLLFQRLTSLLEETRNPGTDIAPPVDFREVEHQERSTRVKKKMRRKPMETIRVAVASGKGGTGKTTVATNLVVHAAGSGVRAVYADCDVEEPNGHLFLRPVVEKIRPFALEIPSVVKERCTGCGRCGEVCAYSAIVVINKKVLTFPELCHSCGGCWLACPEDAIEQGAREIGVVETGRALGAVGFVQGRLRIGEAMAPPLIKAVKRQAPAGDLQVFDAPPGTACPVIQTVRDADYVLLVTEPTPFGLNDLRLAVEMLRELGRPFGVVINRADVGDDGVTRYCAEESIEILQAIPDDRKVAEAYARGEMAVQALPEYREVFQGLLTKVMDRARGEFS